MDSIGISNKDLNIENNSKLEAVLKKDKAIVIFGILALSAIAWAYMFYLAIEMKNMDMSMNMATEISGEMTSDMGREMAMSADTQKKMSMAEGMHMEMAMPNVNPWGVVEFILMFVMWAVMMIAMMFPSATPTVLIFARVNRLRRQNERPYVSTTLFLLGYAVVWSGFSLAATVAQWALHTASLLSPMMVSTSPYVGGAILLAAGIFQFTPIKRACLTHCRTPIDFLMQEWRDGSWGAFVMGLKNGYFCVGCCWILMALLFVAGVMNLLWVAVIAAFVLIEKISPSEKWVGRIAGVLLILWGGWTIANIIM